MLGVTSGENRNKPPFACFSNHEQRIPMATPVWSVFRGEVDGHAPDRGHVHSRLERCSLRKVLCLLGDMTDVWVIAGRDFSVDEEGSIA